MNWERQRTHDREAGIAIGEQKKAIEAALVLIQKHNETPEEASKEMGAPLDQVLAALKAQPVQA